MVASKDGCGAGHEGKAVIRHQLGHAVTWVLVATVGYLVSLEFMRSTSDRWRRNDMIEWRNRLQEANPGLIVPPTIKDIP